MRRAQLSDLVQLSAIARDQAMSALARIQEADWRLQEAIAHLEARRYTSGDHSNQTDLFEAAGRREGWDQWCATEISKLNSQRAALRVEKETALAKARRSFGRAQVLAELAKGEAKTPSA